MQEEGRLRGMGHAAVMDDYSLVCREFLEVVQKLQRQ